MQNQTASFNEFETKMRAAGVKEAQLQSVIAAVRAGEFPAALQYVNFRD